MYICLYKNRKKSGRIYTKLFTVVTTEEWIEDEEKGVFDFYLHTSVVFKQVLSVNLSVKSVCFLVIFLKRRKING